MINIYKVLIRNELLIELQYPLALLIWMTEKVLEPIIYLAVWTSVAASQGGEVNGFGVADFAAYYIALLLVGHLTQNWHVWTIEWYVTTGEMSKFLVRPIHPIHDSITNDWIFKGLMMVIIIPTMFILTWLFAPSLQFQFTNVLLFIPTICLAGALGFIGGWIVGLSSFWTIRNGTIIQMYFLLVLFFSGRIAPLELLPPLMQQIAYLLPFRWFVSFPIEVLLGWIPTDQIIIGMGIQLVWIIALVTVSIGVWKLSLRRYGAVGG
ncbi:MAG: ABC-2 family transporter protein [Anaerolineae bacterium]|nr:ABC-2 family transporter protein [Anaerolineae bacterium]